MMKLDVSSKTLSFEIIITLLFLGDLFLRVLPVVPMMLIILVYMVLRSNKWECIFFSLMCFPTFIGSALNTVGIVGIGGWFIVLGVLLLIYTIIKGRKPLHNIEKALIPFLFVLGLFVFSSFTTTGGSYSQDKIINTTFHGLLSIVAFWIFFSKNQEFNTSKVGVFYIMMSAMMLRLSIITNQIPGPSSLFDFGFLRAQSPLDYLERLSFSIDYQYMGFLSVQGMGFYLMMLREKVNMETIIILLLGLLIALYAGSRQAIVTAAIISALWFLQLNTGRKKTHWPIVVIGVTLLIYLGGALFEDGGLLGSVAEQGYVDGSGRGPWMLRGIELFLENPVTGVGYGRYNILGEYGSYPHNMIIEILCETGLVGFFILFFINLKIVLNNKKSFRYVLFLFIAIFLRAMASAGLNDNIILFSLLFCLPAWKFEEGNNIYN